MKWLFLVVLLAIVAAKCVSAEENTLSPLTYASDYVSSSSSGGDDDDDDAYYYSTPTPSTSPTVTATLTPSVTPNPSSPSVVSHSIHTGSSSWNTETSSFRPDRMSNPGNSTLDQALAYTSSSASSIGLLLFASLGLLVLLF